MVDTAFDPPSRINPCPKLSHFTLSLRLGLSVYNLSLSAGLDLMLQPGKKSKKSSSSKKSPKKKSSKKKVDKKPPADPLSTAAMLNAYYISHDAVDFLTFRGYRWEGASGGKKKKKKK